MTDFSSMTTEELESLRNEASQAYYGGEKMLMSDTDFDFLIRELENRGIEQIPAHGYVPESSGTKVAHEYKMQSLSKVHSKEEIEKWVKKMPENSIFSVQPKYDGFALDIAYDHNGKFFQALTRGDHVYGENLTASVQSMINNGQIPSTIDPKGHGGNTHIRGEAYITFENFAKLKDEHDGAYQSNRNSAPGLVRRNDPQRLKLLSFVAYSTNNYENNEVQSLKNFGFDTPDNHFYKTATNTQGIFDLIQELGIKRFEEFNFNTDGAVVKLQESFEKLEEIGITRSYPKWALAYKYPDAEKQTVIRDIVWSHTRTGKLTPVAVFDPVSLTDDDVTTKASLANYRRFEQLSFREGDHILVVRANGVIPYIVGLDPSFERPETPLFEAPRFFPTSEYPTSVNSSGAELVAHPNAPLPMSRIVEHSISALDIKGVGIAFIEEALSNGVEDFFGFLKLTVDDVDRMRGKAGKNTKSAQNIVRALQSAFEKPLWRWISAIGLSGIGNSRSPILEEAYGSFSKIAEAPFRELVKLEKFNGSVYAQIVAENRSLFREWGERLEKEFNFVPKPEEKVKISVFEGSVNYQGKTVVVTGTFPTMSRAGVQQWVKDHGGKIGSSVSSKTDILLYGEKAGSKLEKAQAIGTVQLVTGEEFESEVLG